jgi:lysozyme family protein
MTYFDKCIQVILRNEGGYINDPNDPGGETNYGISKRSYPDLDIPNLTKEQAIEIYWEHYWIPKLDYLEDINAAVQVFDMCVNAGKYRAVRMAQKVSFAFEDGIFGDATVRAVNNCIAFVGHYKNERIRFYQSLDNDRYIKGWINRVNNTKI